MNALGAGLQLVDWPSGTLRQAYVVDPYLEAFKRVPDSQDPYGRKEPHIYGEEYLETIGEWYGQSTEGNNYMDRVEWGCSGDGIPYEYFKAMEELALTAAYVVQREDGTFKTYNCSLEKSNNKLTVTPAENIVRRVHFNLKSEYECDVVFDDNNIVNSTIKDISWMKKE